MHLTKELRSLLCMFVTSIAMLVWLSHSGYAENIDSLKPAIVSIKSKSGKTGTGFIVRLTQDSAYVVTAYHVVKGDDHPSVVFFPKQSNLVAASRVSACDLQNGVGEDRGLAILVVEGKHALPSGLTALSLDPLLQLKGGSKVEVIGHLSAGEAWSVITGSIICVKGLDVELQLEPADEGCSGAPVIVDNTVVGLITAKGRNHLAAIPSAVLWFYLNNMDHGALGDTSKKASPAATARKLLKEEYGIEYGSNAFVESLMTGDVPVVQLFLMANPNLVTSLFPMPGTSISTEVHVNQPTTTTTESMTVGVTALALAAAFGHKQVVQDLILAGADVNAKCSPPMEITPLATAAAAGRAEIVDLLVKSGANVDLRLVNGNTALILTASSGSLSGVKALLKAGADANAQSDDGDTALSWVNDPEQDIPSTIRAEMRKVLEQAGAK